jgi:hypothetical protein
VVERCVAFERFAPLKSTSALEVLAGSRTLQGSGAAGVATVGVAGVEVAQQVLAETQDTVLPLVHCDRSRRRPADRRHRRRFRVP